MNDRFDDQQLGESVRDSVARNVRRVAPRPDADDLFARVGVRAARQRRSLAASAVALVAVASLVAYSIGTTVGDDGPSVAAPRGQSAPVNTVLPDSVSSPVEDPAAPLLHLFTRTVDGVTARVYVARDSETGQRVVVAEMSTDAAVGVGRAFECPSGGFASGASGVFGAAEGDPVAWVIVSTGPAALARARLGYRVDEMQSVQGLALLAVRADPAQLDQTVELELLDATTGESINHGWVIPGSDTVDSCPPPATLPPAGTQPADVAAAEAGVREAYTDVYDNYQPDQPGVGDTATDERVRQALREAGFTDEQLAAMTVEVGEIRFTDETHAAVLFRLTIPEHADGTQEWRLGYAVFQDGRWIQAPEMKCEDLSSIGVSDVRDCP